MVKMTNPKTESSVISFTDAELTINGPLDVPKVFNFSQIFGPENTNQDIYPYISHIVRGAIHGENNVIMAYGGLGTSSSSLIGTSKMEGVMTMALSYLCDLKSQNPENVILSCKGVYVDEKDIAYDRFTSANGNLYKIKKGDTCTLKDLTEVDIKNYTDFMKYYATSSKNISLKKNRTAIYKISYNSRNGKDIVNGSLTFVDFINSSYFKSKKTDKSSNAVPLMLLDIIKGQRVSYELSVLTTILYPLLCQQGRIAMIGLLSSEKKNLNPSLVNLHFLEQFVDFSLVYPTKRTISRSIWENDREKLLQLYEKLTEENELMKAQLLETYETHKDFLLEEKEEHERLEELQRLWEEEKNSLVERNAILLSEIEEFKNKSEVEDEEYKSLKSVSSQLQAEIIKLNSELQQLQTTFTKAEAVNKFLLQQNEQFGSKKSELMQAFNEANARYTSLKIEVEQLSNAYSIMEKKKNQTLPVKK